MQGMAKLEIETKARLVEREAVMQKLESLGCVLGEPKTQDDTVFAAKTATLEEFLSNDVFLRIRIQDGQKVVLTAKKPVRKSAEVLVKHEHETVVESAEQTRAILELMGLVPVVRTVKVRRTGHVGTYEVCIDDIEGLGSFIELEVMGDAENAERVQAEMGEFLASLGINASERVTKGYDILMLEQQQ